ncbi:MAG: arginine N-succinyltransferase [Pseudohongiellaceae bacterium]
MWQVRPIQDDDLPGLEALLQANSLRLSTLSTDRGKLEESIASARRGFSGQSELATLLFVLQDGEGRQRGICGIQPRAGADEPFYSYRIDELIHASRHLGIHQRQSVLYLSHELTGLTSLCSFALHPALRDTGSFDLLARSRLLYIAAHRPAFADELICEVQGIWDEAGESVFWRSVGELFFGLDFITADEQCALHGKTMIAELLPAYPVYNTLLAEEAQQAVARPHPGAVRTTEWLEREGLEKTRFVDPFDAGPTWRGRLDRMTSLRAIRPVSRLVSDASGADTGWLVSQGSGEDFRCVSLRGELRDDVLYCNGPCPLDGEAPALVLPQEVQP